jgi:Protein of unknown function (DUF2487)
MRWNTLNPDEWKKVATFVDTLCLPVYSFTLKEKQPERKRSDALEEVANRLEALLAGRLLLLPAIPLVSGNKEVMFSYLREIIRDMNGSGFLHLVILADSALGVGEAFTVTEEVAGLFRVAVVEVDTEKALASGDLAPEVDRCYSRILDMWQSST